MWIVAVALGALSLATRLLSPADAWAVTRQVGPVLVFLVGITVVAELADKAHVFDVAAVKAARTASGHGWRLYALVVVLGTATTVVLSLDTTAVLLTPVLIALAQRCHLRPLPLAMTAVWLANIASLLLPVSNLTNLIALHALGLHPLRFASHMWAPQLAALTVGVGILALRYRRDLGSRYDVPERTVPEDKLLFRVSAAVCVVMAPLFAAGLPVAAVATVAAIVLLGFFIVRRRDVLSFSLVPWRLVLLVEGLFLVVTALGNHGLDRLLGNLAGNGHGYLGVLRTAGVGAAGSNLVNNLPAYLALDRVTAGDVPRTLAALVGTNVGPLITVWASLATLLWRERCKARGVEIRTREFETLGVIGVPLMLVAATAALYATS
ncbi:MAG: arsenical pump rane protein [Frankiaceae bacterium]|nr:arsenical pump rane protein [Frankiaceae bacterium]